MLSSMRRAVGRVRRRVRGTPNDTSPPSEAPFAPDEVVPLVRWAQHHGVPFTTVAVEAESERRPPRTVEPDLLPTYAAHEHLVHPERVLATVAGARLVGPQAAVVAPDDAVILATEVPIVSRPDLMADVRRRVSGEVERAGDWFSLVPGYPENHYHLLHDAATRLPGVLERLPEGTRFVVSDMTPESHREIFTALGVPEARMVVRPSDETWVTERLHVVSPAAYAGHDRPDLDRAVRDAVMVRFGIGLVAPTRRIFVSRRGQRRRVVNEDEVLELLTPYGFEVIVPEELSLREQVAVFAESEVVVSNHGSAFAGALFAPPGLRLVDAVDPQMHHCAHVFWSLSGALGHEYWYLHADRVPAPHLSFDEVRIPVDVLARTLAAMGLDRVVGPGGSGPGTR